jgi:hypothetical protein
MDERRPSRNIAMTIGKLIKCLSPAVKVVQAFSIVFGEAVSQVKPHNLLLVIEVHANGYFEGT